MYSAAGLRKHFPLLCNFSQSLCLVQLLQLTGLGFPFCYAFSPIHLVVLHRWHWTGWSISSLINLVLSWQQGLITAAPFSPELFACLNVSKEFPHTELPLYPSDRVTACSVQGGLLDCSVLLVCIPGVKALLVSMKSDNKCTCQTTDSIVLSKHSRKINNSDCRFGVYPTRLWTHS